MNRIGMAIVAAVFALAGPAQAEVLAASDSGFHLRGERQVAASPEEAWRALHQIGRWWNADHTYSGDAANLSLDAQAGGCFCERWADQSVEHGRVVLVMEHEGVRSLRILGALGPLQELAAAGALTFSVAAHAEGATITLSYRVSGDASHGLAALAPAVDGVLMNQLDRLARFAATGAPSE